MPTRASAVPPPRSDPRNTSWWPSCSSCRRADGRFGAWFETVEQLGQKDSLLLSREWELPPESASEIFQAQQPPEGSKPWSGDRQGPDAESNSSSSSSTAHSSVQLQGGPDLGGGDAADSAHTPVAGSSGSVVEIHLDHVPEAQDGQEVKVTAQPCSLGPSPSRRPSCACWALPMSMRGGALLTRPDLLEPPRASQAAQAAPRLPASADLPCPTTGAVDLRIVSDRLHRHVSVGRNILFLHHPSQGHPDQPKVPRLTAVLQMARGRPLLCPCRPG
ncbi:uncharacterized protein [Dasypus novemcinctus]|uniref:uncharacterized protein n=1 Tax=Dasypus novemcinctus TaxID=9361 RepID=UPI0039C8DBD6